MASPIPVATVSDVIGNALNEQSLDLVKTKRGYYSSTHGRHYKVRRSPPKVSVFANPDTIILARARLAAHKRALATKQVASLVRKSEHFMRRANYTALRAETDVQRLMKIVTGNDIRRVLANKENNGDVDTLADRLAMEAAAVELPPSFGVDNAAMVLLTRDPLKAVHEIQLQAVSAAGALKATLPPAQSSGPAPVPVMNQDA